MKRNKTFWIALILVFLAIGFLKGALRLPNDVFWKVYIVLGVLVVIVVSVVNMTWYKRFTKKIQDLAPLLEEEPERFIAENETLLAGRNPATARLLLCLNICAGYCALKQFEKAKTALRRVNGKDVRGSNQVIYYMDLAYVHFYLGEEDEALSIMRKQRDSFARFKEHPQLGSVLAVLSVFADLAQNGPEDAAETLTEMRAKWGGGKSDSDFDYLGKKINRRMARK